MTLLFPLATYGAEYLTLKKDIAKRLATFERNVLRRMFGRIEVRENWRKRYNKELMQLFGDFDILSFLRVTRWNWIGHINRMDSKRKVSQVFNNNPQGGGLKGQPKSRWWNCVQTHVDQSKITNWK
jgi:hypothetical protein